MTFPGPPSGQPGPGQPGPGQHGPGQHGPGQHGSGPATPGPAPVAGPAAGPAAAAASPAAAGAGPAADSGPLRVSTLELFFDLVFAFTLTQLTALLARHLSGAGLGQVLLIFGVLWWMYGGYAWLTNTRRHDRTAERLLLLLGMAGFLIAGLAIPHGFGRAGSASGAALGLGYLLVVGVHSSLYYRANRNIVRVVPFNLASALLVVGAGLTGGSAAFALWGAALAIQVVSPLVFRLEGRFEIRPAHFVERHGALLIVALGESVAAVGIGAAAEPMTLSLAAATVLGLALSAALWWVYFGAGDDERAERALTAASPHRRPVLALSAYFNAHIPILLGVVVTAAGVTLTIGQATRPHPAGQAAALAGGVALFLAGVAWFRAVLRTGSPRLPAAVAVFALATVPLGITVATEAQLALLVAGIVAMLGAERYLATTSRRGRAGGRGWST